VFTTYSAATPQIYLNIDRERAETLGIPVSDIFSALQTTMSGSSSTTSTCSAAHGRSRSRQMPPTDVGRGYLPGQTEIAQRTVCVLRAVADIEPSPLRPRSSLQQSAIRDTERRPCSRYSSGEAIAAMEEVAKATMAPGRLPSGPVPPQEKAAAGQTGSILALAVLFAYLFLVALHES
jgi:multidrug efflux pump subunit AcrB